MSFPAVAPLLVFVVPLLVSWLLCALVIRWAPRLGLVDRPDPRKSHKYPTPQGGGLAITAAFGLALCLFPFLAPAVELLDARWLLGLPVVLLGLIDDLRTLPWRLRLAVHFLAAGTAALMLPAENLPLPAWLVRALVVLWTVGLVNAFNMLDNMDLLSAGTAWIAAGWLALAALLSGRGAELFPHLALVGALSGFLWHNRPPARLFMGDAGSTFLGFFLGLSSARLVLERSAPAWVWVAPLCLLAVPWYDLVTVVLLRLRQGRSPFHADRQHLSHRLVALGLSAPLAVAVIHLLALAGGAAGLLLYLAEGRTTAALVGVQFVSWWAAVVVVDLHLTRRHFRQPP